MTKHTAAPWHIGTPPPNGEQAIGAQNGMMVAIATTGVGMKEETLANARLIAAAPELLEALKEMCSYTAELNPNQGFDGFDDCAVNKARAAIVKATGEQA